MKAHQGVRSRRGDMGSLLWECDSMKVGEFLRALS